jgi:K(+)-stimulated pyrophosphate-energized sodium pump
MDWSLVAPLSGIAAILFAAYLTHKLSGLDPGTDKMREISGHIASGARSYLRKQYRVLAVFVIVVAAIIAIFINLYTALAFAMGAVSSAAAGNVGMRIATQSNAKTAQACRKGLNDGLRVAFSSGTVMGMCVTGIGLLGVLVSYYLFRSTNIILGYSFGASSIALFARVGGGIFTKAADVGADLVGKLERGIPEDDPRNAAAIADNVGDNVGDVAGMGADLFESYVASIVSTMVIGFLVFSTAGLMLPLVVAGLGILSSIIGFFFVRAGKRPEGAIDKGIFASSAVLAITSYFAVQGMIGQIGIYYAILSGLVAGLVIGLVTEYYTSQKYRPTRSIADASQTGAGTTIITGLAVGMESTVVPVLVVCASIIVSYYFGGIYGITISAVGMLSTLGITLASDCYGPVADNAAGISEMAKLGPEIRKRAESLDSVGNTMAAVGKGFAIGSAALTAIALFVVYSKAVGLTIIDIMNPYVVVGLFIGGMLPFVFSSMVIKAVGKTAYKMVREVRRQFNSNKAIMAGKALPNYNRCIEISTNAAIREMMLPGVLAVAIPIVVGLTLGAAALGGLLAGATVTGFALALMMANCGGAWDNAKKYIEEGNLGGKGSYAHKASIVGDTTGDPLKDASGPAMNILIKLMSIVALVFASLFL